MSMQFSDDLRNAWLDLIEFTIGPTAILEIRTGNQPATCSSVATGTLLATITLPSDWMNAASAGVKSKLGTWSTTTSITGTPGHFRVYNNALTVCSWQGSASLEGGGGDMEIDIVPIVSGFQFTVTVCTLTAPGA